MIKAIKTFSIIILVLVIASEAFAASGVVQNLRPQSEHVLNTPSQVSLIEMEWELPDGYTSVTGYYYQFTNEASLTLDDTSTAELTLIDTAYAAKDYSGSNDVSVYVYVAAVAYNEETYTEEIGETTRFGPVRIDTVAPDNAGVSVDSYIDTSSATLTIGGFGSAGDASQMYISNVNYETSGTWESIVASKPWPIEGSEGRKTIYVRFKDDAGNTSDKSVFTVYDETPPTASMISTVSDQTNSEAVPVTVIFQDPTQVGVDEISAFAALTVESSDISVTNGIIENFTSISSGSSATAIYRFDVKPVNQGNVSVKVLANTISDQAGNGNTASETLSFVYDTVSPQVTILSQTSTQTNISPIPVTLTFSEAVTGFDETDMTVNGGTILQFNALGDNRTYTVTITPSGQGNITIDISEACASDTAGNTNTAAQTFSRIYDSQAPSVSLSSTILSGSLAEITPIPFTAVFNETVEGFQQTDISVQNASVDNFSGTSDVYYFNVFPVMPSGLTQVEISVVIQGNSATDLAGNNNTASEPFQFTYTTERPTVSFIAEKSQSITPQAIALTIVFSRPVTGFETVDINVSNGSIANLSGIDGADGYTATYLCTLTPDGQQDVRVTINENVAETSGGYTNSASSTFVYDINDAPTIVIDQLCYLTFEDSISPPVSITVSDPDGDLLTVTVLAASIQQYTLIEQVGNSTHLTLTILPATNATETVTITVMVTDPYQLTRASSFALQITPVNDPPHIIFTNSPVSYTENDSARSIDSESEITDIDSINFSNGYMIIEFTQNATNTDTIFIASSGSIAITNETISYEGSAVASYTSASNNQTLTITFNSACGAMASTAILQHIFYENSSENPSELPRQLRVVINDGETSYSTVQIIQVIGVNDLPQDFTLDGMDAVSIPDGLTPGADVATLIAADVETQAGELSYTFVSGDGDQHNALFTIEGNLLKVIDAVSYENHPFYNLRLQVTDEHGGKTEKAFLIVVTEKEPDVVMGIPTLNEWATMLFFTIVLMAAMVQLKKQSIKRETSFQL
ncbi:MAG: cadherin repeat domain-containing protein [Candidatus Magnetomorum sp.]|nr:cadherin repeat domain-containing protein [Candidatus Magnetomorum sp.]